jgi:hypothetical protein
MPDALAPLMAVPNWVFWKWATSKKGKPTKLPYMATRPSAMASTTDFTTWASYDKARTQLALAKVSGLGFCLLDTCFGAFDIDNCRDPATGELDLWAEEFVQQVGSYTEITISGTGLRIIGYTSGDKVHRKQDVANGVSLETYRRAERYIVMTGNMLPSSPTSLVYIDKAIDETVAHLDRKPVDDEPELGDPGGLPPDDDDDPPAASPTADDLDDMIRNGCGTHFNGDRSRALWAVINKMLRRGHSPASVIATITDRKIKSPSTSTIRNPRVPTPSAKSIRP